MKRSILAVTIAATLVAAAPATVLAEDGAWLVRARAVHLAPANQSDALGGAGPANRLDVESRTIPELDINYTFSPHWAAELVLTVPQQHDVTLDGAVIGSFRHLPPTLLAQYRFTPHGQLHPYVGAGINYTRISSVKLLGGAAELEKHSIGPALQAGFDWRIDQHWSLNLDLKRVAIRSDVLVGGAVVSQVKVDPTLFGLGIGYRF